MNESSTAPTQLDSRRRTPALLGIFALVLLQFSIATHQFQHVDSHDLTVCHLCNAFSQLDDTLVDSAANVPLPVTQDTFVVTVVHDRESATSIAPYRSRAPPLS